MMPDTLMCLDCCSLIDPATAWPGGRCAPCGEADARGQPLTREIRCTMAEWLAQGPQWVKENPNITVRLTDREPLKPPHGDWLEWPVMEPSDIPPEIGRLLPTHLYDWMTYDSPEQAHAALGQAALEWARREAASE